MQKAFVYPSGWPTEALNRWEPAPLLPSVLLLHESTMEGVEWRGFSLRLAEGQEEEGKDE